MIRPALLINRDQMGFIMHNLKTLLGKPLRLDPLGFIKITFLVFIIGTLLSIIVGKEEILPTFYVSLISLFVVYQSGRDSWNKFRLDLFEKRYQIYRGLIEFSSSVLSEGDIKDDGVKSAYDCFRGLKYHESQFLFGNDVNAFFYDLNKDFSWLVAFRNPPHDPENHTKWVDKKYELIRKITNITSSAPKLFAPYLYFGDVRNIPPR